jgi:hypothetical protein
MRIVAAGTAQQPTKSYTSTRSCHCRLLMRPGLRCIELGEPVQHSYASRLFLDYSVCFPPRASLFVSGLLFVSSFASPESQLMPEILSAGPDPIVQSTAADADRDMIKGQPARSVSAGPVPLVTRHDLDTNHIYSSFRRPARVRGSFRLSRVRVINALVGLLVYLVRASGEVHQDLPSCGIFILLKVFILHGPLLGHRVVAMRHHLLREQIAEHYQGVDRRAQQGMLCRL